MHVLVSGSSGLVGSALVPSLTQHGHRVTRLIREKPGPGKDAIEWHPERWELETSRLEGLEAMVHLAGESIAGGRWTARKKARIRESRVQGTRLLCERLAQLRQPPRIVAIASAIGFYSDRGDEVLDEASPPGKGFLAEVCREWEAAADPARQAGLRVVHLRFGMILSAGGGALTQMLTPFRLGLGGRIGSGRQFMSWIAIDDAVGAIEYVLAQAQLSGPVNVVAPNPVPNAEFTRTLGRVLSRPTVIPVPAFGARLAFGQMADELLLASTRVFPRKLLESDYTFRFPELEGALRHLLNVDR